jgi:GT2 family glycosyltransferase
MNQGNTSVVWPIGIRLFNRPDYTQKFLESLTAQTLTIDVSRVICFVDAYPKSSDYFQKVPDRTAEVIALVERYLPGAQIIHPEVNVGLANALFSLQEAIYALPNSEWGIFLEDDLVLDASYLEVLCHFTSLAQTCEDVVKVSACQIHTGYLTKPPSPSRNTFFLGEGTKAIAERASFFELRRGIMQDYLKSLAGSSYRHRDRARVFATLAKHGIFSVMGNNDGVLDQCVAFYDKLHVTFERDLVEDIGLIGESNFVIPQVLLPKSKTSGTPLATTEIDLSETIDSLRLELSEIQECYFESQWQVYRRANSVQHTVKFVANKLIHRLFAKIGG